MCLVSYNSLLPGIYEGEGLIRMRMRSVAGLYTADMELSVKEVPERLKFNPEPLRCYLAAHLPGFQCVQDGLRVKQFSNGQSNPTYLLQPTSGQEFVLRRRPPGKLLPGAHRVSRLPVVECVCCCL